MRIIPVIDYFKGQVVLAKHGQRDHYQPVNSELCVSTDPISIIESILSITGFNTIYIADLDSIERKQSNHAIWQEVFQQFSTINFWLDIGIQINQWNKLYGNTPNVRPVIGSESIDSLESFNQSLNLLEKYSPILSLDFKNNQLLGPQLTRLSNIKWPQIIILLSLDQVGSFRGPDFSILDKLIPHLPADCHVYLGGGVRNRDDLAQAKQRNVAGVLMASALHSKTITRDDLAEFIFE